MSVSCLLPCLFVLATTVSSPDGVIAASMIEEAVVAQLRASLPAGRAARVELSAAGGVRDQRVPAGVSGIETGEVVGPWPRRSASVPVTLTVDGRAVRVVHVRVSAREMADAWVYAGDFPAGAGSDDVALTRATVDVLCCSGTALDPLVETPSGRLRHAATQGRPVMAGDFEARPEVSAGARVRIEVARGPVRLAATGRATDDGRRGESVGVMVDGAEGVVRGVVSGPMQVAIHE